VSLRRGAPWLAVAVAVVCGLPLVGRGFTSEDFLLLRVLTESPPWQDLHGWLFGPWLGIDVVRFYRPVSQLLLAFEANLFGAHSWLYGLVHLAVHAGCVALVYRLGRQLAPAGSEEGVRGPLVAALLFAVYPLHPNAVAWIASYATLFAAAFALAALSLWLDWRRLGGGWRWGASFGLFLAALGSYEAAVVVPLLLAGTELLRFAEEDRVAKRHVSKHHVPKWRALALAPFFVAVLAYLLFRRAIFGAAVGGYESFANRLAPGEWAGLAADAVACLFRLLHPIYGGPLDGAAPSWAALAVLAWLVVPVFLMLRGARPAAAVLRRWGYAWAWALVSFLPFSFQPFVPANGRYAYLAAAGLALGFGGFVAAVGAGAGRRRRAVVAAVALTAALGVQWLVLLPGNVVAHRQAGEEARRVSARLADGVVGSALPGPLFVTGHPVFVRDAGGTPLAQVLRYGLNDSLRPPFRPGGGGPTVYPLPGIGQAPVAALRWEGERELFEVQPAAVPAFEAQREGDAIRWEPVGGADGYRLVVATAGNPGFVEAAAGTTAVQLPADFVRSMQRLYAAPTFWWVEARAGGRVVALSRLQEIEPAVEEGGRP